MPVRFSCHRSRPTHASSRSKRRGMTLVELMVSLTLFGLVMAAMTSQLIESVALSLKTARTLEFASSSRLIIDRMAADVGNTQSVQIYPSFTNRSATVGDGGFGNYVVLHSVSGTGVITRTVGYYLATDASGMAYSLYRHDSNDGVLSAGNLPDVSSSATHRRVVRTLRLASGTSLFRNFRNRGFSFRGEFGATNGSPKGALEFIQCALTTRS